MVLTLIRDLATQDCTLGTLTIGSLCLQTMELPWRPDPPSKGGHPDTSCVPPGIYQLVRHDSISHPRSFCLVNPALDVYHEPADIPPGEVGRYAVLLHCANEADQLAGCCAVGRTRSQVGSTWVIGRSKDAYDALMALLPWVDGMHQIVIEDAPT